MVYDVDQLELPNILADDAFQILFTSGTTGHPKGAVITHFNYLNTASIMASRYDYDPDLKVHHRIILQCPLSSAIAVIVNIMGSLVIGATLIIPGYKFKVTESLEAIDKEKLVFNLK